MKIPKNKSSSLQATAYETERQLREFCEYTSEQLGTVLGVILGELQYSKTTKNEPSFKACVEAAEMGLKISRNLRYFGAHANIHSEIVDLSQLLIDVVEMVEEGLEREKIQIHVLAEASTYIPLDPAAIEQVILNLIDASRMNLPQGGRITLSLRQQQKNVLIQVEDTGEKLDPQLAQAASENHFSSHSPVAAISLELSVAKVLLEAHGGQFTLSHHSHGNLFQLEIPWEGASKPGPRNEKRKHRRAKIGLSTTIQLPEGKKLETQLTVLGAGGCFLQWPAQYKIQAPPVHSFLEIEINYFKEYKLKIKKVRVASHAGIASTYGLGLEFLELDAKAKHIIAALVKSHPT